MYMKRGILFLAICFLGVASANAQYLFHRVYGGNGYDTGAEVIELSDTTYLVAGTSGSYESGMSSQILLLRTDQGGHAQWTKTYGGQFADVAESMVEDVDGNFLIAGFSETMENSYQGYALKVDVDGDTLWTRKYGGTEWDFFHQALPLSDGGFALLGQTYSFGNGEGDVWLVRIDADGDTLWTKTYGGTNDDEGRAISFTSTGGFYLAGNTRSFGAGGQDFYMIKTDAQGDTIWTRTTGGSEDEICYGSCTTSQGDLITVGGSRSNSPDEYDFMRHKVNSDGDSIKSVIEDGSTDEFWTDIVENPDDQTLMLVGWVNDSDHGMTDFRFMRVSLNITYNGLAASRGTPLNDRMFDIKTTADGGFIMVGVTTGWLERLDDVYLYKMGPNGEYVDPELGVEEVIIGNQSYAVRFAPNPVTEDGQFLVDGFDEVLKSYNGPFALDVYDGFGRKVATSTVNSGKTAINLTRLSAGIHYYRFVSEQTVLATGKLLKTK